jgi:hypothetical protein
MSAKRKADSQVPAEESDLLLIRPLYVSITVLHKLQIIVVPVFKKHCWILTSLSFAEVPARRLGDHALCWSLKERR